MLYLCQLICSFQPQTCEVHLIDIMLYMEFDHYTPLPSHHLPCRQATIIPCLAQVCNLAASEFATS